MAPLLKIRRAPELLTDTRMKCFRRCPREHQLRYQQGLVPLYDAEALRIGTLTHHGLEAWWLHTGDQAERIVAAIAAVHAHASDETDGYELAKVEVMLAGYDIRWGGEDYEVLAVEKEFRIPLQNPHGGVSQTWQLAGKIDALVLDRRTNATLLVEHKTTSQSLESGSSYWSPLTLNSQLSVYFAAAQTLGYPVQGCLYDVIRKPALRPLQANSRRAAPETVDEYRDRLVAEIASDPDRYFQRRTIVRLESQVESFASEIWEQALMMRDAQRNGWAPKNSDQCERFGRTCSYLPICAGEASADDPTRYRRLPSVHPELAMEETHAACQ